MHIRRELQLMLIAGLIGMVLLVALLMFYCLAADMTSVHLAVLAVLTTTGPLIARVFEGLVRRRQRLLPHPQRGRAEPPLLPDRLRRHRRLPPFRVALRQ